MYDNLINDLKAVNQNLTDGSWTSEKIIIPIIYKLWRTE